MKVIMEIAQVSLYATVAVLLVLVGGIRPARSEVSLYELRRLAEKGDLAAKKRLEREEHLDGILALARVASLLLAISLVLVGLNTFPYLNAVLITSAVVLLSGWLARVWPFRSASTWLYRPLEPHLVGAVGKFRLFFKLISGPKAGAEMTRLSSKEELIQLVEASVGVLNDGQKKLISAGLDFDDKRVVDVMTPRDQIDFVKKSEILGPMVLNDLHNMGHSHIPVVDRDIDHVVGVLNAADLLVLSADSKSPTVEKVMEKKVHTVAPHDSLAACLNYFLKNKQHIAIVVNRDHETVGLITLTDVLTALVGRDPLAD